MARSPRFHLLHISHVDDLTNYEICNSECMKKANWAIRQNGTKFRAYIEYGRGLENLNLINILAFF